MSMMSKFQRKVTVLRPADLGMLTLRNLARGLLGGDKAEDRIVPPTGHTARLTLLTAAAMAFLAVFALALSTATGRLAERWSEGLAKTMTVRITASPLEIEARTKAVLEVLSQTSGVLDAKVVENEEMEELLRPWFGPDVPVSALPIPRLIEVNESGDGIDPEGLGMRLAAEAPGAVLDDHTRWRQPLVTAAKRLRVMGWFSLILITGASAGMIALAARASLAANVQVVRVLRMVGARDITIATAFVRRFTRRAVTGSAIGVSVGMLAIFFLPEMDDAGSFLTGLGFQGWGWLAPLAVIPVAGLIGFVATRNAALSMLREVR